MWRVELAAQALTLDRRVARIRRSSARRWWRITLSAMPNNQARASLWF
jgi:hypothetical protein